MKQFNCNTTKFNIANMYKHIYREPTKFGGILKQGPQGPQKLNSLKSPEINPLPLNK